MGIAALKERIADRARRAGDLKPLGEPVRKILWEGNRVNKNRGLDPNGVKYAKLKPSTLARRPRPGNIPFMTQGPDISSIVKMYVVNVQASIGRLTFTGAWPGLHWPEYHVRATANRAARDPYGFRKEDMKTIHDLLRDYVVKPERSRGKSFWKFWSK